MNKRCFKITVAAGKGKSRTRRVTGPPCSQFSACLRSVERWLGATSSLAALPGCAWLLVSSSCATKSCPWLGVQLQFSMVNKFRQMPLMTIHKHGEQARFSPLRRLTTWITGCDLQRIHGIKWLGKVLQPWPLLTSTIGSTTKSQIIMVLPCFHLVYLVLKKMKLMVIRNRRLSDPNFGHFNQPHLCRQPSVHRIGILRTIRPTPELIWNGGLQKLPLPRSATTDK